MIRFVNFDILQFLDNNIPLTSKLERAVQLFPQIIGKLKKINSVSSEKRGFSSMFIY